MATSDEPQKVDCFTNARGEKLYRWCLPNMKSPDAVCIMVHGVGDHAAAYESVAEILWRKHKVALYGYDQVGHGRSDGARVDIKDFQYYVDDLLQFVNIVKGEHSKLPVFIMGHSMGGLVLGQALLREPELCEGVIMYAAAVHTNPQVVTPFKVMMTKMLSYVLPKFPVGGLPDDTLTRNKEEVERLKADSLRHHGGMKARWGHNTLKALADLNNRLPEIVVPMLIAHGGDDMVCHVDGSKALNERISSPDKTLNIYEKCYHRIHTEPDGDGERFVDDVGKWITSHCG